jgi:hypothetical protein
MNSNDKKGPEFLLEKLDQELERLDSVYDDIAPPSLSALTLHIKAEAARRRARERKELLLFWMCSVGLVSIVLTLLTASPMMYLVIQMAIPAAALIIAATSRILRKGYGAEE